MREEAELSGPEAAPLVTELARLARQGLLGDASRRDEASFARVGLKVERRKARRRALSTLAAAAALAVLVTGSWFAMRSNALTYSVVNGAVVEGDRVVGGAGTRVRFSDGSEIALAPGAATRITALDANGGHLALEEGTANVTIEKLPGAAWTLAAGPYSVRVTGTAFSLRWSGREQAFEIAMQSGSVVVSGPLVSSGVALQAGQRMATEVDTGKLTLDDGTSEARGAADPAPAANPQALGTAAPDASAAVIVPNTDVRAEPSWAQRAAAGEFAAVIDAAQARGLAATLGNASLSDLSALADSARYLRRTDVARRTLLAQRSRFPASAPARDAAFFLGRMAEDEGDGRAAVDWYDKYLRESGRGPYVAQALGRKMMLVYRQRGAEGARAIALDYRSRFPKGPYAAAADTIVREASD